MLEGAFDLMEKLGYFLLNLITKSIQIIPFKHIVKVSNFLGSIAYYVDSKHRKLSLNNLDIAFPKMDTKKKKEIARKHYINLVRTTLEFVSLSKINKDNYKKFISHRGEQNFAKAYERGKGVLFLAAHFGNWELMAFVHPFIFEPVSNLARKFKDKIVDDFINRIRCISGNGIIDKKNALYRVLKELKNGKAIGVLMDQSVHPNEAVYADFFGKFISTTPFIVQVAMKTGCAIVPVFDFPQKDGSHIVEYFPEIEIIIPNGDIDPVIYNVERFNEFIEKIIFKNPEYWLWSHDRWKNISAERCWGKIKKKMDLLNKNDRDKI
jgi:Kdo2-lipid IVA lauroyltransferase/acyltransferase